MNKVQKSYASVKKKGIKDRKDKSRIQISRDAFSYNPNNEIVAQIISVGNHREKYERDIERLVGVEPTDYSVLYDKLKKIQVKGGEKKTKWVDIGMVPYEIPPMYSLKSEEASLVISNKRMNIISSKMCRTDVESISLDWKRVGVDLNGAIYKIGRGYVGRNG